MGVKWVQGTPDQFRMTPHKAIEKLDKGFDMNDLVEQAARMMREMIATRGTGKVWSRSYGGRSASIPGRVDSGQMMNAVSHQVIRAGRNVIRGEFGWINTQEPYFMYQEEGFQHWITGDQIPGMLALEDAGIQAREEFVRRVMEAMK